MSEITGIGWCHHTFNPWWGCVEVSPACDFCYAREDAHRYGFEVWGKDAPRRFFGEKHWNEPLRWERKAYEAKERRRVFCASMADIGEVNPILDAERRRLWKLVKDTFYLDWLLLTKRPHQLVHDYLPEDWGDGWYNGWLGTTVESDDYRWRIDEILEAPAVVHFLSIEPQLGAVNLEGYLTKERSRHRVDWVIFGGESGSKQEARPFHIEWAEDMIDLCKQYDVPVFNKQLGTNPYSFASGKQELVQLKHRKGADVSEWSEKLRVQEFPTPNA